MGFTKSALTPFNIEKVQLSTDVTLEPGQSATVTLLPQSPFSLFFPAQLDLSSHRSITTARGVIFFLGQDGKVHQFDSHYPFVTLNQTLDQLDGITVMTSMNGKVFVYASSNPTTGDGAGIYQYDPAHPEKGLIFIDSLGEDSGNVKPLIYGLRTETHGNPAHYLYYSFADSGNFWKLDFVGNAGANNGNNFNSYIGDLWSFGNLTDANSTNLQVGTNCFAFRNAEGEIMAIELGPSSLNLLSTTPSTGSDTATTAGKGFIFFLDSNGHLNVFHAATGRNAILDSQAYNENGSGMLIADSNNNVFSLNNDSIYKINPSVGYPADVDNSTHGETNKDFSNAFTFPNTQIQIPLKSIHNPHKALNIQTVFDPGGGQPKITTNNYLYGIWNAGAGEYTFYRRLDPPNTEPFRLCLSAPTEGYVTGLAMVLQKASTQEGGGLVIGELVIDPIS